MLSPQETNDHLEIGQVIERYFRSMDSWDYDLLETVFTVRQYVVAALALVAGATLAVAALVFLLSIRLREREVETLVKIGAARATVATVLAAEVAFVLVAGGLLAALLSLVVLGFLLWCWQLLRTSTRWIVKAGLVGLLILSLAVTLGQQRAPAPAEHQARGDWLAFDPVRLSELQRSGQPAVESEKARLPGRK